MTLLALGDSIMWGQGLRDGDKFVTRVAAARGGPPRLLAHSGATIARTTRDDAPATWGEVPEAAPSITAQLDTARQQVTADEVDVVLLNGGINDVSVFSIVVAAPWDAGAMTSLTAKIDATFGQAFPALLSAVAAAFPRATVVVTPYYPIVSAQTDPRQLVRLMKHLPGPSEFLRRLDDVVEHLEDSALLGEIDAERQAMIEQSAFFASRSRELMSEAIGTLAPPGRAVLADLAWSDEHAFAAPATWLWEGADDPMHVERLARWAAHLLENPIDWPLYTPIASLGHPSVLGAGAYVDAVTAALGRS